MEFTKPTSRFRFNKFVSQTKLDQIRYAYDVTTNDLDFVQHELSEILKRHSITLVVAFENHSSRGIL